ncbi:MAG: dihydrodipicolinate synthase family protein [Candidatus Latescibacteria bacterium]|nr:dihydrodipicolinate synthase family protein [Candidatus Latescibacterota bacterium]
MSNRNLEQAKARLKGPVVPMTTPIKADGAVDYEGLSKLTRFYVEGGIKVFIAVGTTGYCYALTEEEHKRAVETIVQASEGRAFVIAGVSHSGTMMSNRLADICEKAGADALLMTPPYYHQTDAPEGVYRHYKSVAENHSLGLIVYKTPTMKAEVDFFKRLGDVEHIIGIKDASGDYNFARECSIELGERFVLFSGGSMRYYLWHWLWGAKAYVTGIANLVPRIELDFFDHLQKGNLDAAKKIVVDFEQPFFEVMIEYGWHESLHAALKIFGLPAGILRLPLVEPPKSQFDKMEKAFRKLGLLR